MIALTSLGLCSPAASQIVQNSSGNCTVNLANISGSVRIENNGCLDERVLKPLLDTINRQDRNYQEKAREVEGWIKRYLELSERMGMPGAFAKLREEARAQFLANDLEAAARTKQKIIEQQQTVIDQIAADYYDVAELLIFQLKPLEAQQFYAKAFRHRPEIPKYAEAYARSLCDSNQRKKAVEVYETSIAELRTLAAENPARYGYDLACTFVDLTGLYYASGDYPRALEAAQQALNAALGIPDQGDKKAKEQVANASVALGISQAKLRDADGAKKNLLLAEQIYSEIGVTNFNRPLIYEVLATLAMEQQNREEEGRERERVFTTEIELFDQAPYLRRSRVAEAAYQLVLYHRVTGNPQKAQSVNEEFTQFAKNAVPTDAMTTTFLKAVATSIGSDLLAGRGNHEPALGEVERAIKSFESIRGQLRPKEVGWLSLAYSTMGWIRARQEKYPLAIEAFDRAVKTLEGIESPHARQALRDRRLMQFFVTDFATAATELLSHFDDRRGPEVALWEFFIRRRTDAAARLDSIPVDSLDEFTKLVIAVNSGAAPRAVLTQARTIAEKEKDFEARCKRLFFVGESLLLHGDKARGLETLKLCPSDRPESFYPWLMKAEMINWSSSR